MDDIPCPNCGHPVPFNRRLCPACDADAGFPNVRRAAAMQEALYQHYAAAEDHSVAVGTARQFDVLEKVLNSAVPTINISPKLMLQIALGAKYMSYYKAEKADLRVAAKEEYHVHRAGVDARIHPGCEAEIINATLSPDGNGLTSWGEVAMQLSVGSIAGRTSVLRENAFDFYNRFDLGTRGALEELGWRAVWSDRVKLGAAHIEPSLTVATSEGEICDLVLMPGLDRSEARYIELHIWGEIHMAALAQVVLAKPLTEPAQRDIWDMARSQLTAQLVPVIDRTAP